MMSPTDSYCQDHWIAALGSGYTSLGVPTQGPSGPTRSQWIPLYRYPHRSSKGNKIWGSSRGVAQREAGE